MDTSELYPKQTMSCRQWRRSREGVGAPPHNKNVGAGLYNIYRPLALWCWVVPPLPIITVFLRHWSPVIIALSGILSPPAEKKEEFHFCLEIITKEQFLVFKLPCCGHYSHKVCFKTWASHVKSTNAAPTAEQQTRTKTRASSVYKHTPKNSTIQRAAMRKFTQNAPQPSQLYSHSYPTITHWNADSLFIVINSGYMYKKQFIRTVLIETFIVNVLLL